MDINGTFNYYKEDIDSVYSWCEEMYREKFSKYFDTIHILYNRFKSIKSPVTDEELETILIDLPLQLFSASEELNKFRLQSSVIKLKKKEKKIKISSESTASSEVKRNAEADVLTTGDEILGMAVSTVITRVENEISFSRELIMSAKKLWDGRRGAESSNPVGALSGVDPGVDLPDYKI